MTEQQQKTCNKNPKNSESRKGSPASHNSAHRKQSRKGVNPNRFILAEGQSSDFGRSMTRVCNNSACRAVLLVDDAFCRRCSCCICRKFDDNKDPSLWLVCESESARGDYCGLSCHIECAFQQEKVGVVKLGQYMQLDGSYCCAFCGKVQGILRCWKKQLEIAKEARRIDVLCYRIMLSYRLLDGTSRLKELHEIVTEAKTMLEAEVSLINGDSLKMVRGIVSRLSVAVDVQKLCSTGIDKAEKWLASGSSGSLDFMEEALPVACMFHFEDVSASSLAIVLVEIPTPFTHQIKGYKLWYCESRDGTFSKEPAFIFPREETRILVKNLQPSTEYTFRITFYTDAGNLGHSEAKCLTKTLVEVNKDLSPPKMENSSIEGSFSNTKDQPNSNMAGNSGAKTRDLGKILRLAWAQERGSLEGFCSAGKEQCCGVPKNECLKGHRSTPLLHDLDLNVASVPDLNEEFTPPIESSRDEDNGVTLKKANGPDDDAVSPGIEKNGPAGSNGSGPGDNSQAGTLTRRGDAPAVDSQVVKTRKRASCAIEETHDCGSGMFSGSPLHVPFRRSCLDEVIEYCIKSIRWLECEGLIDQEFRLKMLSWFSLRASDQERRAVHSFIRALGCEPKILAGQLVESFTDIMSTKKLENDSSAPSESS